MKFIQISPDCANMRRKAIKTGRYPKSLCESCPVVIITNEVGRMARFGKFISETMKRLDNYGGGPQQIV